MRVIPVQSGKRAQEARLEKIARLEAKRDAEGLTKPERAVLARTKQAAKKPRPSSRGPASMNREGVVHGGLPAVQGDPHPNLLRGRDRHFGAKTAQPAKAFQEAVDQAVAQKLAEAG